MDAPILTGTAGDQTITLQWLPVADAIKYRIRRRVTPKPFRQIKVVTDSTSFKTKVVNGKQYDLQVVAVDVDGQTAKSNIVWVTPRA